MKADKTDLQKLNEMLEDLYNEETELNHIIEDLRAKLDLYLKKLDVVNYDIEVKELYIDIIKKDKGVYYG